MNYDDKWESQIQKVMKKNDFEHKIMGYFQTTVKIYLPR